MKPLTIMMSLWKSNSHGVDNDTEKKKERNELLNLCTKRHVSKFITNSSRAFHFNTRLSSSREILFLLLPPPHFHFLLRLDTLPCGGSVYKASEQTNKEKSNIQRNIWGLRHVCSSAQALFFFGKEPWALNTPTQLNAQKAIPL